MLAYVMIERTDELLLTYDLDARGSPFSWIYVYPLFFRGSDSAPVARVPQHRSTHNALRSSSAMLFIRPWRADYMRASSAEGILVI